jgi:hypothetical protein
MANQLTRINSAKGWAALVKTLGEPVKQPPDHLKCQCIYSMLVLSILSGQAISRIIPFSCWSVLQRTPGTFYQSKPTSFQLNSVI